MEGDYVGERVGEPSRCTHVRDNFLPARLNMSLHRRMSTAFSVIKSAFALTAQSVIKISPYAVCFEDF